MRRPAFRFTLRSRRPGEEKVVQMKGVMSLSPAMVKEINEGGALTISSPLFLPVIIPCTVFVPPAGM